MSFLTFDLGTKTGWAARKSCGLIVSGSEDFAPDRGRGGTRFLKFKNFLTELKAACGDEIEAVYYEDVKRHLGTQAAHIYGGFEAILTMWCEHHNIHYEGVPVGTIKKHATGAGNAKKPQMIAEAQRLGFDPVDENEADALALMVYAIEKR